LRYLEKNPDQRFASAADLERALAECPGIEPWRDESRASWWRDRAPELKHRARLEDAAEDTLSATIASERLGDAVQRLSARVRARDHTKATDRGLRPAATTLRQPGRHGPEKGSTA
jgi:hypothetical protein